MKIHAKLEPFKTTKNVKKFSKLLMDLELDLRSADVSDFEVEIWEKERPSSALKRFLTLEGGTEAHQMLIVAGNYKSRPFTVAIPMRNSRTMPYSLSANLSVTVDFVAEYKPALVGGIWKIAEGSQDNLGHLKRFKMPKVAWTHSAGGYNFRIFTGSVIAPSSEDPSVTIWSIQSGFQGNMIKRSPRVAKYLQAVEHLETALSAT